ncbi:RNA polymerase ECF family sigma subunit [Halopolyspora algeriensis]|uniref:RNA polymerase ECF family sigma subunit n=1 Tax=Halopolyspora algeriensis TaxID=1500506 RepID=A0A368VYD4_9ACTN|nr:RNA polymerase sigma factor SigM [Halopolyspora algeriensis]RCW47218.1 RNA polymerase ECF family sigma subunit [Halopolyspora algeriensis]TQM48303.1 RNA polymerase ECF family sigma subunit [Halopolyspora algeriensis]
MAAPLGSDFDLLAAHTNGDPHAFSELFRRHRDRLWAVALRTMRDHDEAADALQDAMLSAFRSARSFRAESQVTTWLHRIVVNACLDRIRRRQARATVPLPDSGPGEPASGNDAIADQDVRMVVQDALERIPENQRVAIVLVDIEGYPVSQAAVILDVAEGTVKSRCARARIKLARLLGHLRNPDADAGVEGDAMVTRRQEGR